MGEQITVTEIQFKHHRILLDFRRQDYIIQSEIFEEAWNSATEQQQNTIIPCLIRPNPDELRCWVIKIMLGGTVTTKILKEIARLNQIPHYSRMSKLELEDALSTHGVKIC